MNEQAAEFILTKPPLEELTDIFADVVERFRNNMLSKAEAVNELLTFYDMELTKYVDDNIQINGDLHCRRS